MKRLIISVIFLVYISTGKAQTSSLDNLLEKLKNAAYTSATNTTKGKETAHKYFDLAQKEKSAIHLTNASQLLAALERKGGKQDALFYYDSVCVSSAASLNIDDTLFNALQLYVADLLSFNKTAAALPYLQQTTALADKLNNSLLQSNALKYMGFYYYKNLKMKEAQQSFRNSLAKAEEANNEGAAASVKLWIALTTIMTAKIDSTAGFIFEALDYFKKVNDNKNIAECYGTLGFAYQCNGNVNKALEYHKLSYDLFTFEKDHRKAAKEATDLGTAYMFQKKYDSSSYFFTQAETLYRKIDYKMGLALIAIQWGQYYTATGETEKANEYFEVATNINKIEKSEIIDLAIKSYKALNAIKEGNYNNADTLFAQGYAVAKKILPKELVQNAEKRMKRDSVYQNEKEGRKSTSNATLERNNEYDSVAGLNPFTAAQSSLDSSISTYYNSQLLDKETKYKTKIIQDSLQIGKQREALAREELKRRNITLAASFAVLLLVSAGLWLQYKSRKRAERDKAIITEDKEQIELLIETLHHHIKNNLGVISSLIDTASRSPLDQLPLSSLKSRVKSIELLHKNLYGHELKPGKINLQKYAEDLLQSIKSTFEIEKMISTEVNANVETDSKKAEKLGLMINELATNSFKYAFKNKEDGKIKVKIIKDDNQQYCLTYADNGTGLSKDVQFNFGMKIIAGLSNQLDGRYQFSNQNGLHFTFNFK